MRKPDTTTAMRQLIGEVRAAIPFGLPEANVCAGPCEGCSMKLMAFLEGELEAWEQRLEQGEQPGLTDISRLAKTSRKVWGVLRKNGVIAEG